MTAKEEDPVPIAPRNLDQEGKPISRTDDTNWEDIQAVNKRGTLRVVDALVKGLAAVFGGASAYSQPSFDKALTQPQTKIWRPNLLNPQEVRQMRYRWPETVEGYKDIMRRHGFEDPQIDVHERLGQIIPPVTDLIRMGVREAFNDETSAQFGADEDFEFFPTDWAEKQGLTPFWSQKFWRSHWELPSIQQGFEMLHRGAVDEKQVDTLLRALDVMPFWREGLKKIAFRPLTRVDVRRMRKAGVLSKEEVKRSYLDLGYDELNANRMTEWTEKFTVETERDLTKSEILKAVRVGQITEDDGREILQDLGFDQAEADFLVTLQVGKRESEERELTQAKILQLFKFGILDKSSAGAQLQAIGYSPVASENLLKLEETKILLNIRELPFGYLRELFRNGLIDETRFRLNLRANGFTVPDQEVIVANETAKKQQ